MEFHNGHIGEVRCCIKNTFDLSNSKILLEDAFPGLIRRKLECLENLRDKLHKAGLSYWLFNTVKNVSSIYIDMTKDILLMFTILIIIGGPTSLYYFPTKLTTVVVFCLYGTIVMPILCTSILHTMEELEKDPKTSFCTKFLKYTISIFIAPIRPLLLTLAYDENRTQRKIKILYNKYREEVLELNKEGEITRNDYARFIRLDLNLQVFFQLSGQIIYLLLASSKTPTTAGLEEMFKKTSDALLAFSIGMSVRTAYFITLKSIAIVKQFVPSTTKIVLLFWIMISASIRVLTLVLYFTPGFGLFREVFRFKKCQFQCF